jgi:hypothetical protein
MANADLVPVRTFMSTIDAELAHGALSAAGIDAMVSADDCGGMRPHLQMGGVTLLVREEDLPDASRILDTPAEDADAAHSTE